MRVRTGVHTRSLTPSNHARTLTAIAIGNFYLLNDSYVDISCGCCLLDKYAYCIAINSSTDSVNEREGEMKEQKMTDETRNVCSDALWSISALSIHCIHLMSFLVCHILSFVMKLIKNVNEDIIFETEKIELLSGRHRHHHHNHRQVISVSSILSDWALSLVFATKRFTQL